MGVLSSLPKLGKIGSKLRSSSALTRVGSIADDALRNATGTAAGGGLLGYGAAQIEDEWTETTGGQQGPVKSFNRFMWVAIGLATIYVLGQVFNVNIGGN